MMSIGYYIPKTLSNYSGPYLMPPWLPEDGSVIPSQRQKRKRLSAERQRWDAFIARKPRELPGIESV